VKGRFGRTAKLTDNVNFESIYKIKPVSQTQQYYVMLVGLHVSTVSESSSGPRGTDPCSE
jgi:hypothetical protein